MDDNRKAVEPIHPGLAQASKFASTPFVLKRCQVFLLTLLLNVTPGAFADESTTHDSSVVHVVLVWLKQPGNAEHRRRIIAASRQFEEIPGVIEVRVGEVLPSQREVVDDSFDVGLYLTFGSVAEMKSYLADERHQAVLRETLKPLTARYLVYDFVDTGS